MLAVRQEVTNRGLDLDYVGVKVPMFSFSRPGAPTPARGGDDEYREVGCLGPDLHEALLNGLIATGFDFRARVLLSLDRWPTNTLSPTRRRSSPKSQSAHLCHFGNRGDAGDPVSDASR
jgi:hypothetical protein